MIHKKYLFDTNALIMASNLHYSPNFCQAFWEWIVDGNNNSVFFTIDRVADECKRKKDYLCDFIEENNDSFVKNTNNLDILGRYSEIQVWANTIWVNGKDKNKTKKALEVFALEKTADPWLVAYASIYNYQIISNEVPSPNSQTSVKLPDAAQAFGVSVVKLHEVLNIYSGHNFSFKAS